MINLFVPWVLSLLVGCAILYLIKRWWKAGLGIAVFLMFLNWHWQVFSFGCCSFDKQKNPDCLRVMTWNICCSDSSGTDDVDGLLSAILEQDADVVFLTEYGEQVKPELDFVMCACYPYKGNIANWITWSNFYSRVPIDTCMRVGDEDNGYMFRYDLKATENSVRIYCVHMHSNNLVNGGILYPDSIQDKEGVLQYLRNYETAAEIRRGQAELMVGDFYEVPIIVMGDMNDVAGSPCMTVLEKAGLKDAWWEGGFGYGATIHEPLPYRIDHVMYSNGLKLKGVKKMDNNGLSDHDALVADFEIE